MWRVWSPVRVARNLCFGGIRGYRGDLQVREGGASVARDRGKCFVAEIIRIVASVQPGDAHQPAATHREPGEELVVRVAGRVTRTGVPQVPPPLAELATSTVMKVPVQA